MRSSATLVQASGDSTGGRAEIEQIVDVPVPLILEQSVKVIKVILQEQCQRMRLFTFERRVVVQQLLTSVFGGLVFLEGCGFLAKARATARVDVQNVEV